MRHLILAVCAAIVVPIAAHAATYELKATPHTVAWGHYDATDKPVLTVKSGDTVVIHTLLTNSPTGLEKAGVDPVLIEPALRAVYEGVPASSRGPGGHILTGPIAIEGAEPGDTLEVRIKKVDLAIPYAYNAFRYGAGFLTDDFPYARVKIVPLDAKRMIGRFAPGIEVPLAPFFGSMGVAPPPSFGRYDSAPPTVNGGNMDDKAL
ncbi:MAG: acetamidase, partial [Alphaproteobacteria bacterium]